MPCGGGSELGGGDEGCVSGVEGVLGEGGGEGGGLGGGEGGGGDGGGGEGGGLGGGEGGGGLGGGEGGGGEGGGKGGGEGEVTVACRHVVAAARKLSARGSVQPTMSIG